MTCDLCGVRISATQRKKYYPYIKCNHCGLLRFNGTPTTNIDEGDGFLEYVESQAVAFEELRASEVLRRLDRYTKAGLLSSKTVFDIGCGSGSFISMATKYGFKAAGCDISKTAVELNATKGNEVHLGTFESMKFKDLLSAVTMFCVIAHVEKPSVLLDAIYDGLEDGGVLYFHTPGLCLIDSIGLAISKITRGKSNEILQRRLNNGHRRIYDKKSIEMLLLKHNFTVITIEKKIGYGLKKYRYFQEMGINPRVSNILGRIFEMTEKVGLLPKNELYVYAKKKSIL
jgi:SAM-dependent methyltransferase